MPRSFLVALCAMCLFHCGEDPAGPAPANTHGDSQQAPGSAGDLQSSPTRTPPPLADNPFPDLPPPSPRPTHPQLTIPQPKQSFGDLWEGDRSMHRFWFRNDGQKPVVIQTIKHSCGCTSGDTFVLVDGEAQPIRTGTPIDPGTVGYLDVEFDSLEQVDKSRLRTTITTNNPIEPKHELELSGKVDAAFVVEPPTLDLQNVIADQGGEGSVTVTCVMGRSFEVTGFLGDSTGLEFRTRIPDPARFDRQEVTLVFLPGAAQGMKAGRVTLLVNVDGDAEPRRLGILMRANVVGELVVEPESLALGSVPLGEGVTVPVTFTSHGAAIEIQGVEVQSSKKQYITTGTVAGDQPGVQVVEVQIASDCPKGVLSGAIVVSTSSPTRPSIRIPFSGFVED